MCKRGIPAKETIKIFIINLIVTCLRLILFPSGLYISIFHTAVWNIEIYSPDGNKISLKQVTIRFIINILIVSLAGIPLLHIYFSSNGNSISDTLSKTSLRSV